MSLIPYREQVVGTTGLVALYVMNEQEGATCVDVKNSLNGTYQAAPTLHTASLLPNQEGASAKFNGTTQYVTIPDNEKLRVGDKFTLEAWFKPEHAEGPAATIIGAGTGACAMWIDEENKLALIRVEQSRIVNSTTKMVTGTSNHLVITKEGATVKLYLNKVDVTGTITNATCEPIKEAWNLMRESSGFNSGFAQGCLQYAAIYNVPLTKVKVEEHFVAGSAQVTSPPNFPIPHAHRGLIMSGGRSI